jgi:hypothetical protein
VMHMGRDSSLFPARTHYLRNENMCGTTLARLRCPARPLGDELSSIRRQYVQPLASNGPANSSEYFLCKTSGFLSVLGEGSLEYSSVYLFTVVLCLFVCFFILRTADLRPWHIYIGLPPPGRSQLVRPPRSPPSEQTKA